VNETVLLNEYISDDTDTIVDVGSGNGLLGIPIAIINKNKKIILVEPKKKKNTFLREVKERIELPNVEIAGVSIEEYLKKWKEKSVSLIARGFPGLSTLCGYVKKSMVKEAILITSENKIKKNQKHLESVKKKIYNVPLRTHLKILKMEKTDRE
jgi:16S rRNA (guanine527-N7)-methyltransferase